MTTTRDITIVCDVCYSSWATSSTWSKREAWQSASRDGWIHDQGIVPARDFCSRVHQQKYLDAALTLGKT